MNKKSLLISVLSLSFLLVSCNDAPVEPDVTPSEDEEVEPEYEDLNVRLHRNPSSEEDILLRFYGKTPHVPYIKVSKYYKEFFNTDLTIIKEENGFSYYTGNDYLSFDTKNNIFSSNSLVSFASHPDFVSANTKSFVKSNGVTSTEVKLRSVDLNKYHIELYKDDSETYVPLTFLSKIAGGYSLYDITYNGDEIYLIDYNGELVDSCDPLSYEGYFTSHNNLRDPRPKDLVNYTYGELCFAFDNLRGLTKQLNFGDENLLSLGLDGLLTKYHPQIKEFLLSENKAEYYKGFKALFNGLYDGGHTNPLINFEGYTEGTSDYADYEDFVSLQESMLEKDRVKSTMAASIFLTRRNIGISGRNVYYQDLDTKTAYIIFGGFDVDHVGWDNYYKGEGDIPVDTDTYAFVRDSLYKAKDAGIENVVLDLTENGGGESTCCMGLIGLFNEAKSSFLVRDTFNGYLTTESYLVDINLDGKFDEEDVSEARSFDFNIGVLTCAYSFSCANLFPAMMKNLGYKTLGQKSGGGSCAIYLETTADGLMYVRSSYICLVDDKGENIDGGIDVDLEIETYPYISSFVDCRDYYNFELVSNYLSNAYDTLND